MNSFHEGQLVAYIPQSVIGGMYKVEIGVIKIIRKDGSIFVWYHGGDTSAKTPVEFLYPIENESSVKDLLERNYND